MTSGEKSRRRRSDWARRAHEAMRANNAVEANQLLELAIAEAPRDALLRLNYAVVLELLGAYDDAAVQLTRALGLNPRLTDAADRLAKLTAWWRRPDDSVDVDMSGLTAALGCDGIGHQPLVDLAFRILEHKTKWGEIARLAGTDPEAAAEKLLRPRSDKLLRDELLLRALRRGINTSPETERLLTALRRHTLLQISAEQFRDSTLTEFILAMAVQQSNSEYVLPVDEAEQRALALRTLDWQRLLQGDVGQGLDLLVHLLYRSTVDLVGTHAGASDIKQIRPRTVFRFIAGELEEMRQLSAAADSLETFGLISDSTSRRVAAQYESYPYPRWKTLEAPGRGAMLRALGREFSDEELAFAARPFDVLVAGAGTGQHACQSAIAYGDNARILAIDLSRTSLAFGASMARRYAIENIRFAQGDLLDISVLGRTFRVIETVGVLHHMADPLEGWRRLLEHLDPGGLMLVGLYSATSRQHIAALRSEPEYPGPGCADDDVRAYRCRILARAPVNQGEADLRVSTDFYSLSGFRDLVLHEHEVQFDMPEIAAFLESNALTFCGFALAPRLLSPFQAAFPDDPLPGTLENWWAFEQANPRTFGGMYNFWCRRSSSVEIGDRDRPARLRTS